MSRLKVFVDAIIAGMFISIGGTVFLLTDSKLAGSILFAVGLYAICTLKFNLFTGKVCYIFNNDIKYLINVVIIWLGNFVGTFLTSSLLHLTRLYPKLNETATKLVDTKLNDSYLSLFVLAIFCNIMIYLGVEEYNKNEHELGKYLGIIFAIVVFIMCGFEHCVANMYYISIADAWSTKALIALMIMTLGNICGGVLIPLTRKIK